MGVLERMADAFFSKSLLVSFWLISLDFFVRRLLVVILVTAVLSAELVLDNFTGKISTSSAITMTSDDIVVDVVVVTVVAVTCSVDAFAVPLLLLLLTMTLALFRVDLSAVTTDLSGVVVVTTTAGDDIAVSSIIVLQICKLKVYFVVV